MHVFARLLTWVPAVTYFICPLWFPAGTQPDSDAFDSHSGPLFSCNFGCRAWEPVSWLWPLLMPGQLVYKACWECLPRSPGSLSAPCLGSGDGGTEESDFWRPPNQQVWLKR